MTKNNAIKKFINNLKIDHLKCTPQRLAVLEEMMNSKDHRECEEVYNSLKSKAILVSRATVYRTMDILVKYNFVRKLELGEGKARYEYKAGLGHHDHLICIECGDIIEFINNEIERLQDVVCEHFNFKLVRHIHQLFGICSKCQK